MEVAYPGQSATAEDLLTLAGEYRLAAATLHGNRRKGKPLSLAPCRLVAIHAIELYLNAFLLAKGLDPKEIRGLQHDLKTRGMRAADLGLVMRKRTAAHLSQLSGNREYLTTRYGPEMKSSLSQINRLMATLEELAAKCAPAS